MPPLTVTANAVLRAYRGPEDHPDMSRVAAAARTHDGEHDAGTVADIDNHYAHLDQAALPRDCTLAVLDGRVVAYGRASLGPLAAGGHRVSSIAFVDPDARGRGVEELLVRHAVRRAAEIIESDPDGASMRVVLYVNGAHGELVRIAEDRGFQRVRRFAQLIRPNVEDIPEIRLPAGFEVRPISLDDRAMHRRIFDAGARAFADSYGEEAASDEGFDEFIHMSSFEPALWRVAFDGERIAGQILSFRGEPEADGSFIGWTEAISVQAEYRRRGLARALLAASLRAVRDVGATSAGLGVDTQNPNRALTLYESLGYRIVSETFDYELGPFDSGTAQALRAAVSR